MLSYGPPHDPYFSAPEEFQKLYDPSQLKLRPNVPEEFQDSARRVLAGYYAHASAIDHAFGKLIRSLDSLGISDHTLVLFTSEHGDMLLSKGVLKKQRPWDESIKVPMLIRYPKKFGKGSRRIHNPIGTPDLLPTLLGISGISIPKELEGKDFSKDLISGSDISNDAALIMLPVPFHEWQFLNGGREYRGIRTSRYTYVKDLLGPWLLYDNKSDPYQLNNLAGKKEFENLKANLENLLLEKLSDRNDRFLPADSYMTQWNYLYDRKDSIRAPDYLTKNRLP
jgi:arylsulfatase A-like enzyme